MTKVAIIGAGLSIAYLLKKNVDVTLFEKARGVSGRMSTRRSEPYFFDHGAQYFTVRTQQFQNFIQPLLEHGIIERWNPRHVKFDDNQIIKRNNWIDEEPHYVGVPGMNKVAKYLAESLNIHINTNIISLDYQERWQLTDAQGESYGEFDWIISTAPSPQSVDLMPEYFKYYIDIKSIKMHACFSLMLGLEQCLPLEFEAAHIINSDLNWIAVNSHKPGRIGYYSLVIHSSAEYAEAHINDDYKKVINHLINETSRIIGYDVSIANYKNMHKWLYANNTKLENNPVFLDREHRLAIANTS